jgi:hypothetical protein
MLCLPCCAQVSAAARCAAHQLHRLPGPHQRGAVRLRADCLRPAAARPGHQRQPRGGQRLQRQLQPHGDVGGGRWLLRGVKGCLGICGTPWQRAGGSSWMARVPRAAAAAADDGGLSGVCVMYAAKLSNQRMPAACQPLPTPHSSSFSTLSCLVLSTRHQAPGTLAPPPPYTPLWPPLTPP